MRIKLDENVTIAAQTVLIKHGHDAHTIHDEDLIGAPDSDLLTVCRDEQRMLVTFDLGFGDLRAYPPGTHPGVICSVSTISSPGRCWTSWNVSSPIKTISVGAPGGAELLGDPPAGVHPPVEFPWSPGQFVYPGIDLLSSAS